MRHKTQKEKKRNKSFKKKIAKIALYLGIGASFATMLQVAKAMFTSNDPIPIIQNSSGDNSPITQVALGQGNVYVNSSDINEFNNIPQPMNIEVSSEQMIAYSYDLIQNGNNELAIEEIQKFIEQRNIGPMDTAILYYNLGIAYYNMKQYGMAKNALENSVNTAGFADAYYFLGVIWGEALNNYPEAILAFTKALEYETRPEYLLARAWAYENNNQQQDAIRDYCEVLIIDPQNEQAISRIERSKPSER